MSAPPPPFLRRILASLADWACFVHLASLHWAVGLPWLHRNEDLIHARWEAVLPPLLLFFPPVLALLVMLGRELGPWRRSLGMGWAGLRVVDVGGDLARRRAMLGRRAAWLLNILTLGLGFLPAIFGSRRALHERLSGTRLEAVGKPNYLLLASLILLAPLSGWSSWHWIQRDKDRSTVVHIRVGYMDRQGRVVIPPTYWEGKPFQNGVAAVQNREGWTLIDPQNRQQTRPRNATDMDPTPLGMAIQDYQGTRRQLDRAGKPLLGGLPLLWQPGSPEDPVVVVEPGNRVGLRRPDGSKITERTFGFVGRFQSGQSIFQEKGLDGLLDRQGRVILSARFQKLLPFSQDLAPAMEKGRWGFVDRSGYWAIPACFEEVLGFPDDGPPLAPAKLGGKWGYVKKDGNWAIPPHLDQARIYTAMGLARACLDNRWGILDASGHWKLMPRYHWIEPPLEAPFAFQEGQHYGYVGLDGAVVVPPILSVAGPFRHGCAFAKGGVRWIRFDAAGHGTPLPGAGLKEMNREALDGDLLPFRAPEVAR